MVYVPAGTVHTINAGTLLFEIQQKSDLTYRVYDYGRPRPLHLQKALDVIAFDSPPPPPVQPFTHSADGTRTLLLATRHFAKERWSIHEQLDSHTHPTSLEILTVIQGRGQLTWETGDLKLQRGESVVLPAELGAFDVQATHPELTILRCWVPDLDHNVIPHLQGTGASPADIKRVCERVMNDSSLQKIMQAAFQFRGTVRPVPDTGSSRTRVFRRQPCRAEFCPGKRLHVSH